MMHATSVNQFSMDYTMRLLHDAERLRRMSRTELLQQLPGRLVATLFYEPSTRTRLSFEAAVYRLGGQVISAENARETSSSKKGETLSDVFRVVGTYVDAIVIRHHDPVELADAVPYSPVPIINAGAGSGEHPTQALLDVYTIWRELGRLDNLTVTVLGDLKYGRTVHSLLRMFTKMSGIHVKLCHAPGLELPEAFVEELRGAGVSMEVADNLCDALQQADIVYQTRIQSERFEDFDETCATSDYAIQREHLPMLGEHARILHPLPRVGEIDPAVDPDARAAYFRQAENGLYLRMALIHQMLKEELA